MASQRDLRKIRRQQRNVYLLQERYRHLPPISRLEGHWYRGKGMSGGSLVTDERTARRTEGRRRLAQGVKIGREVGAGITHAG